MTRLRELAGMWLTAARMFRDMPAILDAHAIAHAELADEVERLERDVRDALAMAREVNVKAGDTAS